MNDVVPVSARRIVEVARAGIPEPLGARGVIITTPKKVEVRGTICPRAGVRDDALNLISNFPPSVECVDIALAIDPSGGGGPCGGCKGDCGDDRRERSVSPLDRELVCAVYFIDSRLSQRVTG